MPMNLDQLEKRLEKVEKKAEENKHKNSANLGQTPAENTDIFYKVNELIPVNFNES